MSDDEDDYVAFGVSLKPLEEGDNIRKKPIAVEEQIVRDVNGIRRFHGAFTGGFSAGHFNTVNTPQGWYPKQFKSSRETKAEKKQQRPEDFMDDEDRGEFGFAAQALRTKSNFQRGTATEETESRNKRVESVLNSGGFIEQLVKPTLSTLGERLLSSQGWKPGQGIGPKIRKENKKSRLISHIKTYGCSSAYKKREEDEEEDEDPFMEKYKEFLFAPDEIPLYLVRPKENLFGIGYSGLGQTEEVRNMIRGSTNSAGYRVRSSVNFKSGSGGGKKFSITGEAFGIGADEEDDDMDVYNNRGDMAQYDFSLDVKGEERKGRREERKSRWNDQDEIKNDEHIEGFSPATSKSMIKKHFPSTRPPHDWRPKSNPTQQRESRFSPATNSQSVQQIQTEKKSRWDSSSNLSVEQRRSKLFPDECNQPKNELASSSQLENSSKPPTLPEFLQNFKPDSEMSLSSFKPFSRDEMKQKRYDQYLVCIENNRRDALSLLQPKSMTEWEKEREKVEFERASMLFKPMKGVIGSRFVSAGGSEDNDVDQGLSTEDEEAKTLRKAADMKMFGKLTRTSEDWHPARILCVRFNVPHPYGDYSIVGTKANPKKETGVTNVFAMLESGCDSEKTENAKSETDDKERKNDDNEAVQMKVLEDEPDPVKPPADLFKAIFLDSESESEPDESDTEKEEATKKVEHQPVSLPLNKSSTPAVNKPWEEKEGNILRNKQPARGIFANLDLESLNRRKPAESKQDVHNTDVKTAKGSTGEISVMNQTVRTVLGIRNEEKSSSDEEFGPKLPQSMIQSSIVISSDSSDDGWVTKEKDKKKKKKKKSKDKKKLKVKKSVKKKTYSSSRSRSRSSESEDHHHKRSKKKKKSSKY